MSPSDGTVTSRLGLIIEVTGSTSRHIDAAPAAVLDAITAVHRLPEWNAAIESVIEDPGALDVMAEWVVLMHPKGWPKWHSRSTVEKIDREGGRFSYTTRTDDGNPSFATWHWQVSPAASGSQVAVSWHLHPKSIGRRTLIGRLRRKMLIRELDASLRQLAAVLHRDSSASE